MHDRGGHCQGTPVGDEDVPVRMPVGPRPMRLQKRHDADGALALARLRADGGGDGAGGDTGDLTKQATTL